MSKWLPRVRGSSKTFSSHAFFHPPNASVCINQFVFFFYRLQNLGLPFYHANINPFSFCSVQLILPTCDCNSKFQLTFIYGNRTVAEKNAEKKHRTQKVKPKAAATASTSTVEAKKHLAGVRVIQRNLVYIIGLPTHLCNESVSTVSLFTTRYIQVMRHV